jgi:flagellar biogenesis protein FliO
VSGGAQSLANNKKGPTLYSTEAKTPAFWTAVFGGSILTLAFIGLGAWFLRRSRSKAAERGF